MNMVFHKLFIFLTLAVFTFATIQSATSALSQQQENLYRSGIYYYDIGASECNTTTSGTSNNNKIYVIGDSYSQGVEGALKPKLSESGYEISRWNGLQGRSIDGAGNDPSGVRQTGLEAIEADSDSIKNAGTMLVILGTNGINSSDISSFMKKALSYNPELRTYWVNVNYPKGTTDSINQRNQIISSGASEFNYSVVDWHGSSAPQQSKYFSSDGIHPNSAGYATMTDLITSALQPSANSGLKSVSEISGFSNTDYAGNSILTKAQLDAVQENQRFYQSAADKYGIPWQIIAVIHLREHGLQRDGPSNGDGPYQILNSNSKVGEYTDEEFQAATDKAAEFILNKAGGKDLSSVDNIKYTLFAYNGRSPVLIDQGIKLGFTQDQANNGEGSPYVMNRADLKRDPTVEPTKSNNTWGQFKPDFQYPANSDYGAFVQYGAIANISASGGCGDSGLTSGGMTLEQAKAFMKTYETSPDSESFLGSSPAVNSRGSVLGNCVAFSVYFINKYTTLQGFRGSHVGNGEEIADNVVIHNPEVISGTEPKLYAIFSISSSVMPNVGHTGVILGIDTEKGIVITGEAHYGSGLIEARTWTFEQIKTQNWKFSYTDGYLKGL